MEAVNHYFKVQLPKYLKNLPLPSSFSGFANLSRSQWLQLIPFLIFIFMFIYLIVGPFLNQLFKGKKPRPHINKKVKKEEKKVVDTFDIEDIGEKKAFCRCWKSSKVCACVALVYLIMTDSFIKLPETHSLHMHTKKITNIF